MLFTDIALTATTVGAFDDRPATKARIVRVPVLTNETDIEKGEELLLPVTKKGKTNEDAPVVNWKHNAQAKATAKEKAKAKAKSNSLTRGHTVHEL